MCKLIIKQFVRNCVSVVIRQEGHSFKLTNNRHLLMSPVSDSVSLSRDRVNEYFQSVQVLQ
jgi:hypothetical protein